MSAREQADVVVVGGGLAGLVAAAELAEAGRSVLLVDQEPEQSLGGQAFWSLGGLFLVDSPEQRRMRIKDSRDLAWQDWLGTAGFDRPEDEWPRRWAEAYVDWAAGGQHAWITEQGIRLMPQVGWAERGGYDAGGPGNSVPRFHLTWGTGPAVMAPFEARVRRAVVEGRVRFRFRHRVDELIVEGGAIVGVRGATLEPSGVPRGAKSSRTETGTFELRAEAVIVTSGGIGADHDLVRQNWPDRLGAAPGRMISGVPDHVDGRMLRITEDAGGETINPDRMWHYVEGIHNWDPIWTAHGIRIIPGPSSLWLDATGKRLPVPLFPGFDTLGTLAHLMRSGHEHTWFVLNERVIEKEFALSGSEQNPDITGRSVLQTLRSRLSSGPPGPVQAFMDHGADFVVERDLAALVRGMNARTETPLVDLADLERTIVARDREVDNPYTKDLQLTAIHGARKYFVDRLTRVVKPHRLLDPDAGPLIAVKLSILTRKTLGGLHTDLDGRVLRKVGGPGDAGRGGAGTGTPHGEAGAGAREPVPGLYAAGEVAGFGGGGMHGYRALEGTFLGGCLFSGRIAGRAVARALG